MGKKTAAQVENRVRKINGKIGELLTAVELLRHGFAVNWPEIDVGYDLICDNEKGSLKRVQVKTAQKNSNGVWYIHFMKGRSAKRKYTEDDIDFFVVALNYDGQPAFYVIPVTKVLTMKGIFWAAGQHPRYPHKWKTCKWEEYRDRWDLLR